MPLLLTTLAVVTVARCCPPPRSAARGFRPLLGLFFLALVLMVVAYLLLIEVGKYRFYRSSREPTAAPPPQPTAVTDAIEPKDPRHRDLGP